MTRILCHCGGDGFGDAVRALLASRSWPAAVAVAPLTAGSALPGGGRLALVGTLDLGSAGLSLLTGDALPWRSGGGTLAGRLEALRALPPAMVEIVAAPPAWTPAQAEAAADHLYRTLALGQRLLRDAVPVAGKERWLGRARLSGGLRDEAVLVLDSGAGLVAVRARCPHAGQSLAKGQLTQQGMLECPSHGWQFPISGGPLAGCRAEQAGGGRFYLLSS